jgi:hypothetical protein
MMKDGGGGEKMENERNGMMEENVQFFLHRKKKYKNDESRCASSSFTLLYSIVLRLDATFYFNSHDVEFFH